VAQAIMIREYGGPEAMKLETVAVGAPARGELRIRQTYAGVNYHDIYVRSGLYKTLALPGIPGCEAVGVVEAIGEGVADFAVGDRVVYITDKYGAYASERLFPAAQSIKVPAGIDDRVAAGSFLRGLTVDMLLKRVYPLKPGDWALVHAAAGGVGRLLVQWARHIGAHVIGTAGSPDKAEVARRLGCQHVVLYREENFVDRVREITEGRGVDVAYDSVGKDTFYGSLDSLKMCGHLVNYGQASGPVEPVAMPKLAARSATVSRPILFHYTALGRPVLEGMAASLFGALAGGWLTLDEPTEYPLAQASEAHALLESRGAVKPVVLSAKG
jgi:NADPH:quinone reductase